MLHLEKQWKVLYNIYVTNNVIKINNKTNIERKQKLWLKRK